MGELGVFVVVAALGVLILFLVVGALMAALSGGKKEDPAALLAERFAKGEITEQEYTRRLSILTYGPPIVFPPELPGESAQDKP